MTPDFARAYLQVEGVTAPLYCWFNPTTLVRGRRAQWRGCPTVASSVQKPRYLGAMGDDITLNLLLHAEDDRTGTDVQANIDALFALTDATVKPASGTSLRPPTVVLHWGTYKSSTSIAKTVSITIELFDLDGTPLRATATLTLGQYEADPGQGTPAAQNPTTRATQQRRAHQVRHGDSVHHIAYEYLRDPTRWRDIAEANELDDPLSIRSGQILVVPTEDQ